MELQLQLELILQTPLSPLPWTQTQQGGDLGSEDPLTTSRDTQTNWSRDRSNTLYLHIHMDYGQKLSRVLIQDERALRSSSRATIQKHLISSTTRPMASKFSRMGAQVEGLSRAKSNDTCILWSRYKDIFSLSHGLWSVALINLQLT